MLLPVVCIVYKKTKKNCKRFVKNVENKKLVSKNVDTFTDKINSIYN